MVRHDALLMNEQDIEGFSNNTIDPSARIDITQHWVKIRRVNKAISDNLKEFYDFKCQICNENISSRYEVNVVESHHIKPFSLSLNNDASNQIILCPNHHRIIHKAEPEFHRRKLIYSYGNGVEEKIILNGHL